MQRIIARTVRITVALANLGALHIHIRFIVAGLDSSVEQRGDSGHSWVIFSESSQFEQYFTVFSVRLLDSS